MTELMNSSGKCVHRSGLRGVFPQTSTALEVFLQPQLSPPSDYLKECRHYCIGFIFQTWKLSHL